MKKLIVLLITLLTACTPSYSKIEMDDRTDKLIDMIGEAYGMANAAATRVFEKQIKACQAKKLILNLKTMECAEAPKK